MGVLISFSAIKFLFFVLSPFVASGIGLGIHCYIAVRNIETLVNVFARSAIAIEYSPGCRNSPILNRLLFVVMLSGAVMWQSRCIQNGSIHPADLKLLPDRLRRGMTWGGAFILLGGGGCWLMLLLWIIWCEAWIANNPVIQRPESSFALSNEWEGCGSSSTWHKVLQAQ